MNIIKLNTAAPIQGNKYAILLHWKYIYELSENNRNISIDLEPQDDTYIKTMLDEYGITYMFMDANTINNYIDWSETERINAITTYVKLNSQTPAPDEVQLEDSKKFRSWFGNYVLENTTKDISDEKKISEYDKQIISILNFWANNMVTDTIKDLDLFFNNTIEIQKRTSISCGCGGNTGNIMNVELNNKSNCNPLDELIKKYIINTQYVFSDISGFWKEYFSTDMINWIIKYIKSIIKCNLPLNFNTELENQLSCDATNRKNQQQTENQEMLSNIIIALELIRDCKDNTQFNFVNKAMNNFGKIYPYMNWV